MKTTHQNLVQKLISQFGTQVTRTQLYDTAKKMGINNPVWLTKNKVSRGVYDIAEFASKNVSVNPTAHVHTTGIVQKTDEEILLDIRKNFNTLDRMISGVAEGKVRSMIVSGPAGIGKTYSIESILDAAQAQEKIAYKHVNGFAKATGLFKLLYQFRNENDVLVLDDIDSIFSDENALNILKGALDSKKRRIITWGSEKVFVDDEGTVIPNEFEYKGSVIFITNLNFEKIIAKDRANAAHFNALISRSFYIDVNLNNTHEFFLRIKDVLTKTDMGFGLGLNKVQENTIIDFIAANMNRVREISLRMVVKLAQIILFADSTEDFKNIASATCLKKN